MDTLNRTSRFLMQATLGVNHATLQHVADAGVEHWLDQQLNARIKSDNTFESSTRSIWQHFRSRLESKHGENAINGEGNNPALPYKWYFRMA